MKKMLCGVITACLMIGTASAATELQKKDAEFLDQLGLFHGTEQGYELDRTMTRAEGAVMLTRLLGGEQEALKGSYQTPFTDVPNWAKPYVGWLYQNKLTNGISKTKYDPNTAMQFKQYAWFTGRAAGYTDAEVAAGKTHLSAESYRREGNQKITRGQAVALSMDTLYDPVANGTQTLAEKLIGQGSIDPAIWSTVKTAFEQAKHTPTAPPASESLSGSSWDALWNGEGYVARRLVNGKVAAQSKLHFSSVYTEGGSAGIFANKKEKFYSLDPLTLTATELLDLTPYTNPNGMTDYFAAVYGNHAGKALLCLANGDGKTANLYVWSKDAKLQKLGDPFLWRQEATVSAETAHDRAYFGGNYGIVSISEKGEVQIISQKPNHWMKPFGSALYFIARDPDVWQEDIRMQGGATIQKWDGERVSTALAVKTGFPVRFGEVKSVSGSQVTACATAEWYSGPTPTLSYALTFVGDAEGAKLTDAGDTDIIPDNIEKKVSKDVVLSWWDQKLFGSSSGSSGTQPAPDRPVPDRSGTLKPEIGKRQIIRITPDKKEEVYLNYEKLLESDPHSIEIFSYDGKTAVFKAYFTYMHAKGDIVTGIIHTLAQMDI